MELRQISIEDPFWSQHVDLVRKAIIPYQWEAMNDRIPDAESSHCLENFKIAAGRAKGEFYGAVFQDTDVAKWLEAVGFTLNVYPDPELEKTADEVIALIAEAQQPDNVGTASSHYLDWAVTFMLEHRDEFRLLLTCSEGTRFSGMVDEMVRVEVEATDRFMRVLDSLGRAPDGMSPMLEHILVSSMFTGMFEIVIHDMEPEAAITYSRQLRDFFMAGGLKLLGLETK